MNNLSESAFKVMLIHANSTLDTLIPPNLAIMSAVLKQAGHQVKLFDTTFYKTRESTGDDARVRTLQVKETRFEDVGVELNRTDMYEDFLCCVKEYQPDIVGLSAVSLTYPFGIEFLRKLRRAHPEIPTIVGGIHATISPNEVLREDCVDFVCRGEGEYALNDLCDSLKGNEDTTGIRNLWTKKNGQIFQNPPRPPVDINTLPMQDWTIFDPRRINKPMGGKIRRVGCFELDRGCPYSCSYCCNDFWHKFYENRNYRRKDLERFIEEVRTMKENHDLNYVYLASETFLASPQERFDRFIELWKSEIGIPFWVQTRPETITEYKVKRLKEVGVHSIGVGVESGSPEMRKRLNRIMTNDQIINAFEILNRYGLRTGINVIIGFPEETREQIFETIDLVRQLNASNIMTHVFNPYRGTPLYDYCVEKGFISQEEAGGDYRQDYVMNNPNISKEQVLGLQRTFALYARLPRERWPEIQVAEKSDDQGNRKFEQLKKEYTEKFLV